MTKKIPKFKTIQEEARFWDTHDVTDYLDELEPVDLEVDLGVPKKEVLTIRVQPGLKKRLEKLATSYGVNLSTLARILLIDKLQEIKSGKKYSISVMRDAGD